MLVGADLSQYQGVVDWPTLKASGRVSFVIMRATYGLTGIDAQFKVNQAGARSVGIPCGFYHFADGYDAKSEAQHFVDTVGPLRPGETLWLDDEIVLPEHNAWACAFIDVLRPHVNIPGLYSNYSGFRSIGVVPNVVAWIAFPGPAPLAPPAGYTASSTLLNQTSTAVLPGTSGNADVDYLLSDAIEVLASWGAPHPDPPPEEDMQLFDVAGIGVYCLSGGAYFNVDPGSVAAFRAIPGIHETPIDAAQHSLILAATAEPAPIVSTGTISWTGSGTGTVK